MLNSLKKFFRERELEKLKPILAEINALEPEIEQLSDDTLKNEAQALREKFVAGATMEKMRPRAFALTREAARRTLGQRPYDVQILGGLVLSEGAVAEMATGEGKTLAAVAPAVLYALTGRGAHIVTVNEYLARRDAVWMGRIYRALGISVACLVPNSAFLYDPDHTQTNADSMPTYAETNGKRKSTSTQRQSASSQQESAAFKIETEFLRPISRREAYLADITYGTNYEFGFDYLRDNLAYDLLEQVQTHGRHFAIVDEVDSILIDEARTPLIISAPDAKSSDSYKTFAGIARRLGDPDDYAVDEKKKSVSITDAGIEKVERIIGIKNIYAPENLRLVHYLEESLKAKTLFHKDKDYIVKNDEIVIVDEFTGRLLMGRRYNGGLHQAIEAKEGVRVQEESRTYGKISIQNYFRMYEKISGMTGTAQTSAEEFHKVYGLEVVGVPTHRPLVRDDHGDVIYKNQAAKWQAIVLEIVSRHKRGQPVLIGTTSIEKNETLSHLLHTEGIPHEVLNAKNNEREGMIIAQAGRRGSITVATNMAGRGVDIILGGNPPDPDEAAKVRELGGLYVLSTERHESRRIDNQLRGRSGRQGDPGESQFFLALDDDLMRIFGGERIAGLMERFDVPDDQPIQIVMVSRAIAEAQSKVEGANFDMRKHLLEYDDVLNRQRSAVYKARQEILEATRKGTLATIVFDAVFAYIETVLSTIESSEDRTHLMADFKKALEESNMTNAARPLPLKLLSETDWLGDDLDTLKQNLKDLLTKRSVEISMDPATGSRVLSILDMLWMENLESLEALSESIGLRAYGQRDPLVEYRSESRHLWGGFWNMFNAWIFENIFKGSGNGATNTSSSTSATAPLNISISNPQPQTQPTMHLNIPMNSVQESSAEKVGRNDPCPCGSGKKYKKCGLNGTQEHRDNMAKKSRGIHETTGG